MKNQNEKTKLGESSSLHTLLYAACGMTGFLALATIICGVLSPYAHDAHADSSATSNASVTVSSACTLSATGGGSYSANITPGTHSEITGSTLSTVCNDPNGYSIYAIGYSNDSYDTPTNTQMIGTGGIGNISTGTATSGNTSNWAMKVNPTSGNAPTIMNNFDNYHNIPADYTQIAKYTSSTGSTSATGASITSKYQVYINPAQPAGTYAGKVKYTMVHPNTAPAPSTITSFDDAYAAAGKTKHSSGYYVMQDATASICSAVSEDMIGQVVDTRDNEVYYIGKLKDGKCWMLDNLRLGSTSTMTLTPSDTNIASNYTLPASGTDNFTSSTGYTTAAINTASKNTTTTSYGSGSGKIGTYYNYCAASAGTYCYASGSGTGNATYDICPKGWRMPTGGSSGEYQALYTAYSSNATNFQNALSTPLSGSFDNGSAYDQGSFGNFWSSTRSNGNTMYYLYVNSSYVSPTSSSYRYFGLSMRCLLGS